jgi:hypothetical protein
MEHRWVGPDGYEVVPAIRAGRQVLRLRRHGWLVADCASVAELAGHVDLAELCEVIPLARRDARGDGGRDAGSGAVRRGDHEPGDDLGCAQGGVSGPGGVRREATPAT